MSTPHLRLDQSRLAALVVETFLNGIFWVLFIQAAHVLYLANPKTTAINSLYVISAVTADGFMAYRLFIVWRRNWLIIIPPTLMVITLLATGIVSTNLYSRSVLGFIPWITAAFTLTFVCNLYSTSLIAIKIYLSSRKERQTLNYHGSSLSKVLEILVESALLYSSCVLAALVTYSVQSNLQHISIYLISPVIGIIFSMIVIRGNYSATSQALRKVDLTTIKFESFARKDGTISDVTCSEERSALQV